jgi:hypothetical protein
VSKKHPRQGLEDTTVPQAVQRETNLHGHICLYRGPNDPSWRSIVDYANWHAEHWQEWQRCKRLLGATNVSTKLRVLRKWPCRGRWDDVRVVAYVRDMRQYLATYPDLRTFTLEVEGRLARSNAPSRSESTGATNAPAR